MFDSSRHYQAPALSRQSSTRTHPRTYTTTTRHLSSPSAHIVSNTDHVSEVDIESISMTTRDEGKKVLRNSLYLTFNAPRVDEYHRGIFLTHPPVPSILDPRFSGTLFHAAYVSPDSSNPDLPPKWLLDQRVVKDVTSSQSLVLLYRIGTLEGTPSSIDAQFEAVCRVLEDVPLGRENRTRKIGPLKEGEGNSVLDGYDCIIWTKDAISALVHAGLIHLNRESVDQIIAKSRALAGPKDARTMVGVDFGGFKVAN